MMNPSEAPLISSTNTTTMSSEAEDDFAVDPAMAAALGFSSFGTQPDTKRRKYTHNDAVVDLPTSISRPTTKKKNGAQGANALPLGQRRTSPSTSTPEPSSSTAQAQRNEAIAEVAANVSEVADTSGAHPPLSARNTALEGLLQKWDVPTQGVRHFSQVELQALREGVTVQQGYVAYYLPSFIEDPWAGLKDGR